jgi:hypothetical protein
MGKIALAEMVEELRNGLEDAAAQGTGKDLRFELGEVTLEAQVEVERKAEGKAGLKFWVFTSAEAAAGIAQTRTQKIVLQLRPRRAGGGTIELERGRAEEVD